MWMWWRAWRRMDDLGTVTLEDRRRTIAEAIRAAWADAESDVVRHARDETAAERARRRRGSTVIALDTWRDRHGRRTAERARQEIL